VKKRHALDWVLGMLVLAALDDPDDEPVDEIRGGIDYGLDEGIVSLRKRSIGLLPKVVESVHLFHW
jgi:hypothetical protein